MSKRFAPLYQRNGMAPDFLPLLIGTGLLIFRAGLGNRRADRIPNAIRGGINQRQHNVLNGSGRLEVAFLRRFLDLVETSDQTRQQRYGK